MNHGVHPLAWMLGYAMLAIVIGVFALIALNRPIPDIVNDLSQYVVGGVVGMLANTRLSRQPEPTEGRTRVQMDVTTETPAADPEA